MAVWLLWINIPSTAISLFAVPPLSDTPKFALRRSFSSQLFGSGRNTDKPWQTRQRVLHVWKHFPWNEQICFVDIDGLCCAHCCEMLPMLYHSHHAWYTPCQIECGGSATASAPFPTCPNCQISATDSIWSPAIGCQVQIFGNCATDLAIGARMKFKACWTSQMSPSFSVSGCRLWYQMCRRVCSLLIAFLVWIHTWKHKNAIRMRQVFETFQLERTHVARLKSNKKWEVCYFSL